mmetsp:Transcript_3649/g.6418  ORF Transcript_3649/g.6418 Transcript_3649/m.6418 type:complete len:301 (-) Transcript_3649:109-1011(-)
MRAHTLSLEHWCSGKVGGSASTWLERNSRYSALNTPQSSAAAVPVFKAAAAFLSLSTEALAAATAAAPVGLVLPPLPFFFFFFFVEDEVEEQVASAFFSCTVDDDDVEDAGGEDAAAASEEVGDGVAGRWPDPNKPLRKAARVVAGACLLWGPRPSKSLRSTCLEARLTISTSNSLRQYKGNTTPAKLLFGSLFGWLLPLLFSFSWPPPSASSLLPLLSTPLLTSAGEGVVAGCCCCCFWVRTLFKAANWSFCSSSSANAARRPRYLTLTPNECSTSTSTPPSSGSTVPFRTWRVKAGST